MNIKHQTKHTTNEISNKNHLKSTNTDNELEQRKFKNIFDTLLVFCACCTYTMFIINLCRILMISNIFNVYVQKECKRECATGGCKGKKKN